MNTELKITGMTCNHCERAVREALQGVEGVQQVEVDRESGSAHVQGSAQLDALISAVHEEGYEAEPALG